MEASKFEFLTSNFAFLKAILPCLKIVANQELNFQN